jgi:hypothetical protein
VVAVLSAPRKDAFKIANQAPNGREHRAWSHDLIDAMKTDPD